MQVVGDVAAFQVEVIQAASFAPGPDAPVSVLGQCANGRQRAAVLAVALFTLAAPGAYFFGRRVVDGQSVPFGAYPQATIAPRQPRVRAAGSGLSRFCGRKR